MSRQLNSDLTQSVEHWHDDQEVLGSIPVSFCAEMTPHQTLLYLSSAAEAQFSLDVSHTYHMSSKHS